MESFQYIYGPVPSRRLGQSLGIDPIPSKTCNYQCIYCQLGRTTNFTNQRKNFFPKEDIFKELKEVLTQKKPYFDYLTFVGSGEPTLYKDLGDLISYAKKYTDKPICVITNGSLLYKREVRDALYDVEVVLPTLDAGDEKTFRLINRPHPEIKFKNLIEGFIEFRSHYKGEFWIEVMLVKDVNDSKEELIKIKEKMDIIKPDRIDINVPIRPPAEKWVEIPKKSVMSILNEVFIDYNNINFPEMGHFKFYSSDFEKELLSIIERHPMREEQILESFSSPNLTKQEIQEKLSLLEKKNKIMGMNYHDIRFWKLKTLK
jgi:wyosine [tRNA(Phe)-imidazoG37] synthetase (radical SAM superfamily)